MSADDDLVEYEHGFPVGYRAFLDHKPYPVLDGHPPRWQAGAVDGWEYAEHHTPDDYERAVMDADRQHRGEALLPDPPLRPRGLL